MNTVGKYSSSIDKIMLDKAKRDKLFLAQWITSMCLTHNKKPEEIIDLLTEVVKILSKK